MGFILADIITSMERISDHCSNIGVCVTQVREDLYDTHSHLEIIKDKSNSAFVQALGQMRRKYVLP